MSRVLVIGFAILGLGAGVWAVYYFSMVHESGPTVEIPLQATSTNTQDSPVQTAQTQPATGSTAAQLTSTPATSTPAISTPTQPTQTGWKSAIATVFWVGEPSDSDNGFISNAESAWDEEWMQHFGGVDSDSDRCGWKPCAFEPKENPFYVALPYNDLDDEGDVKADAWRVPWYTESDASILKNRWVEVRANGKSCFGQWEDVGPFHEDDIEYVFGSATKPLNQELEKAGIDLSPAMRDCLGVEDVSKVEWRFVESAAVPAGNWRAVITMRK